MSTSGSYNFTLNKTQIISRALQMINVYQFSDTIESDDYNFASDTLNMMIKLWEAEGLKLWKRRQATLFPQANQYVYQIGNVSGSDNTTNTYVGTKVTSAIASSVNIIPVASVVGLSIGMNIGLELDNNSRQWGAITNIVSNNITVSFNTTDTSASNNTVVAYSTLINRPLNIIRATTMDLKNNNNEVPMMKISYDDYYNLPLKSTIPGRSTNFCYEKLLNNSLSYSGTLSLFPNPQQSSVIMNFTYLDSIQDMLNTTDNIDFPQEWLYPLVFNLAVELAYAYGKMTELQILQPKANDLKARIEMFDADDEPIMISVDYLKIHQNIKGY